MTRLRGAILLAVRRNLVLRFSQNPRHPRRAASAASGRAGQRSKALSGCIESTSYPLLDYLVLRPRVEVIRRRVNVSLGGIVTYSRVKMPASRKAQVAHAFLIALSCVFSGMGNGLEFAYNLQVFIEMLPGLHRCFVQRRLLSRGIHATPKRAPEKIILICGKPVVFLSGFFS